MMDFWNFKHISVNYSKLTGLPYHLQINIPLLLLNAEDDPLVPPQLLKFPREAASKFDFTDLEWREIDQTVGKSF